jgi:DNA-directed RNA polymerase specialized sigma24 family protein
MSITKAVPLLRSDQEQEVQKGFQLLWEDIKLHKVALYFYKRYQSVLQPNDWEDLFMDTVLAFKKAISKNDRPVKHPNAYFRGICRNLCEEQKRKLDKESMAWDVLQHILSGENVLVDRAKIETKLQELGGQCQTLLWNYFLKDEGPVTDHEALAELLQDAGYTISVSSVSATLSRCKRKFRNLLENDPSSIFED